MKSVSEKPVRKARLTRGRSLASSPTTTESKPPMVNPDAVAIPVTVVEAPTAVAVVETAPPVKAPRIRLSEEMEGLESYVRVARRHPPLTREQEYALSHRSRAGDPQARQLLVNHNVAFVLSMCRRQAGKGLRLEDLVQEGMTGLLKAVEQFDPNKGNRFSTYASWWIRAYVQKFMREMRATVKPIVSAPGQERFALPRDFSLDAPIGDDEDTTYLDRLEDDSATQEDGALRNELSDDVRDALEKVRKRIGGLGWDIIQRRFEQDEPQTLEEIGKDWGLSRERVRQVEKSTRAFLSRVLEPFAA